MLPGSAALAESVEKEAICWLPSGKTMRPFSSLSCAGFCFASHSPHAARKAAASTAKPNPSLFVTCEFPMSPAFTLSRHSSFPTPVSQTESAFE
jgi:hypothetical protein